MTNIKEKIIEICNLLDELEDYFIELPLKHSTVDGKICDLLHVIEYNKLTAPQRCRIIKELHQLRLERRKIKNDEFIAKTFTDEIQKILKKENRQFLIASVSKKEKSLVTSVYKNRVYTGEEIRELIGE